MWILTKQSKLINTKHLEEIACFVRGETHYYVDSLKNGVIYNATSYQDAINCIDKIAKAFADDVKLLNLKEE